VRKFTAREAASGVLLGFIFFDGVYEAGKLVGYYANVTRMRPDAHPGVLNLLVSNFMDRWGGGGLKRGFSNAAGTLGLGSSRSNMAPEQMRLIRDTPSAKRLTCCCCS
jgi:hypothetical protein